MDWCKALAAAAAAAAAAASDSGATTGRALHAAGAAASSTTAAGRTLHAAAATASSTISGGGPLYHLASCALEEGQAAALALGSGAWVVGLLRSFLPRHHVIYRVLDPRLLTLELNGILRRDKHYLPEPIPTKSSTAF